MGGVDIWSAIERHRQAKDNDDRRGEEEKQQQETETTGEGVTRQHEVGGRSYESYMLFVGEKESGKTTIISQFLNPTKVDEKPKSTVALEFTYGRRTSTSGERKDIVQIWELGGGSELFQLVSIVLQTERLGKMVVVIVVDLSDPGRAFCSAREWFIRFEGAKYEPRPAFVLIGNKYDKLQDEEGLKRKLLAQSFRHLAHIHGAGLIFASKKEKVSLSHVRSLFSQFAFGAEAKKSIQIDPNKPIFVPPKLDSLDSIGIPPGVASVASFQDTSERQQIDYWENAVLEYYPRDDDDDVSKLNNEENKEDSGDEAGAEEEKTSKKKSSTDEVNLAPEPAIDAKYQVKRQELEAYKKKVEREARLEKASSSSSSTKPRRSSSTKR